MATNKFAGTCTRCGEIVRPGAGELYKEFDNHKDEVVWKVRHSDTTICAQVEADQNNDVACNDAYATIVAYIKEFGDKQNAAVYGTETIIDKRRGYNHVGWIVTADAENTIFLTSQNSLDGFDMSETYTLTDGEDEGFGNSNDDIKAALTAINNGIAVDSSPFEIA